MTGLLGLHSAHADTIIRHQLDRPEGPRNYLVMQAEGLPATLRPVVILLHGHGASAAWMLGQESFSG